MHIYLNNMANLAQQEQATDEEQRVIDKFNLSFNLCSVIPVINTFILDKCCFAAKADYDINNLADIQIALVLYIVLHSGIRAGSAGNDDGHMTNMTNSHLPWILKIYDKYKVLNKYINHLNKCCNIHCFIKDNMAIDKGAFKIDGGNAVHVYNKFL